MFVNRDLKPENIVFKTRRQQTEGLVIIDFGDAEIIDKNKKYNNFIGSPFYIPPESLREREG